MNAAAVSVIFLHRAVPGGNAGAPIAAAASAPRRDLHPASEARANDGADQRARQSTVSSELHHVRERAPDDGRRRPNVSKTICERRSNRPINAAKSTFRRRGSDQTARETQRARRSSATRTTRRAARGGARRRSAELPVAPARLAAQRRVRIEAAAIDHPLGDVADQVEHFASGRAVVSVADVPRR